MNNASDTLVTDMELFAAALFQRKVLVIQRRNNVVLLYPGKIEQYDEDVVCISGAHYKRNECDFHML
ncbi:MAG: hypothetical protein H7X86_05225 [Gorillibacterium sp.]|nr:hypothetical protein [Gorillibacterium sp.]